MAPQESKVNSDVDQLIQMTQRLWASSIQGLESEEDVAIVYSLDKFYSSGENPITKGGKENWYQNYTAPIMESLHGSHLIRP